MSHTPFLESILLIAFILEGKEAENIDNREPALQSRASQFSRFLIKPQYPIELTGKMETFH
jgi:hypothetical protein